MSNNPETIHLKDYARPHFWIKNVELDVDIYENETFVVSELTIERNLEYISKHPLILDGVELELLNIELNNIPLHTDHYQLTESNLTIHTNEDSFTLITKAKIHPENNLSCEGLYKSGNIFCTQNEAQGFRKITWFLDRPDVMSKFKTTVRADKNKFPYLLSNGNKLSEGELLNSRHFVTWEDPHLKPCYLFALVAGDLAVIRDTFTTKSKRLVSLEIFVDKGNEDKCTHAMESLKNSMKWDEDTFGLEYDLDIYMIVAVDSFNMGAMENKGLNIFNSAYVLAKPETATDVNFQGIEAVIGHEYFHNWTGNRVTCRDWFQLTLKEGLTVFRDQEFSSDMLSRPVKRIDDVKKLREFQFPEDAGPMAHPIRPKSYIEINNFYTATVYEKGSEIIRMIHTLLGKDNFRKGMDLYFKRFDGQAVTTEDFVNAMSDASGKDLTHFKAWYDQVGTPTLNVSSQYNKELKTYSVTFTQKSKIENENFKSLHMPLKFGIIGEDGCEFNLDCNGIIELSKESETFVFKNITSKPVPSWNREFSAPVILNYPYSDEELVFLMANDTDEFNRFDACQNLYKKTIYSLQKSYNNKESLVLNSEFKNAFSKLLTDSNLDPAFLAYALSLPSVAELCEALEVADYDGISNARTFLEKSLGENLKEQFLEMYHQLNANKEFKLDAKSMGQRALKNVCLSYLFATEDETLIALVKTQFETATNMTDESHALNLLSNLEGTPSDFACDHFYKKWKHETLVMQKWFSAQATSKKSNIIDRLKRLEASDVYDKSVPNILRSLVGAFANRNPVAFNAIDGSGYEYVAQKVIDIDKYNPQIASKLAKSMNHLKKLDPSRREKLKSQLEFILSHKLSPDTYEVVSKNLN